MRSRRVGQEIEILRKEGPFGSFVFRPTVCRFILTSFCFANQKAPSILQAQKFLRFHFGKVPWIVPTCHVVVVAHAPVYHRIPESQVKGLWIVSIRDP